jgi:signal transduction histidine kinase
MRFHRSLRYRVALAFALFGGLVSLLLAAGLYVAAHDVGERLIDETLKAELEDYMARRSRNPHSLPPSTVSVLGYVLPQSAGEPDIPPALHALPPGRHELDLNGTPYRVAVVDRGGKRYFMLHNLTRQQHREVRFLLLLGAGVLVMSVLSAAGGLWLAGRVIAPVTELARRVHSVGPSDGHAPLAEDFPRDEVGELARAFDQSLARMRGFIDREREFTADVSHELRTPLAVIQGAVEVLLADPGLSERLRERLARMERASIQMSELTSALLLMAREKKSAGEAGALCDAEEVLQDVMEKHRYLLHGKETRLVVEIRAHPRLPVERTLLFIVIGNLVRNAFSYTDRGEVRISLDNDRLTVADTGIGIRAEELDHIFQRHYKGAASKGAGIGLSLVKRICDRQGWEISIDSREGQGTVAQLLFQAATP